uniref:Protein phosphatase 1D-like n=1 Tax=Dermatophagoides pteronyssinus TaxID=6956 RepID=A0A6P6XM54_DERPT|nr:protein phosphatase 1D-like [Dermatophagoides pteronyssinus]
MKLEELQSTNDYSQSSLSSSSNLRLRISVSSHQGGRKYMEDEYIIIHYQPKNLNHQETKSSVNNNDDNLFQKSFVFFGIFDGHGGDMAARYTRQNLCHNIVRQRKFWSNDDDQICLAIHKGFVRTQKEMLREVEKWPRTTTGLPSTSGTTASILFIMNGKYYTGHVGDSRIVLGRKIKNSQQWQAYPMTRDHKPESPRERKRIEATGGQVMNKSGIGRVVWNRPRRIIRSDDSTIQIVYDMIPFLSVARSLGDLWSLNRRLNKFIVSPEPDVKCIPIDTMNDKCLILASDGLWNMINHRQAIKVVQDFEEINFSSSSFDRDSNDDDHDENQIIHDPGRSHSLELFAACIDRWMQGRSDNTTVLVVMLNQIIEQQQQQQGNHHQQQQIFDQYEFDLNSEDSFGSSSSSSTTLSPSSSSSLITLMIGDTIHSLDRFDRQQTDENFLEIKPKDDEEIELIVDQILNRLANDDDIDNNLPSINNELFSELIDDEQMSSIKVTTIQSDYNNNNNKPIVSICELNNHSSPSLSIIKDQQQISNVYCRINFNYSFNHYSSSLSSYHKSIQQGQSSTTTIMNNGKMLANKMISSSSSMNDLVVSRINLINSIENLSSTINRNVHYDQKSDSTNLDHHESLATKSIKRKISSSLSLDIPKNLLSSSSLSSIINNNDHQQSDNIIDLNNKIDNGQIIDNQLKFS